MALEELKAQIGFLMQQMVDQPQDAHEVQERLREKLNEFRAMGMPLPDDLVELEKKLDAGFDTAGGKA
ncbi:putative nucleic acid-binding Zn-ribbon protein [Mesorhizobium soli]|uniref:hypothetical protein n=1 Tax=Pseudaminobacter soli (ex Li et al. 2025) TaxID=1295366 RepID=UPI0024739F76|nr:hypothetical protein [Mesorhizobium soli]MDH6230623.1 putative nucleic acid-binding Zn-ribbon protein [Mesorhizobium soli]